MAKRKRPENPNRSTERMSEDHIIRHFLTAQELKSKRRGVDQTIRELQALFVDFLGQEFVGNEKKDSIHASIDSVSCFVS